MARLVWCSVPAGGSVDYWNDGGTDVVRVRDAAGADLFCVASHFGSVSVGPAGVFLRGASARDRSLGLEFCAGSPVLVPFLAVLRGVGLLPVVV